jgi:hypothetical protein
LAGKLFGKRQRKAPESAADPGLFQYSARWWCQRRPGLSRDAPLNPLYPTVCPNVFDANVKYFVRLRQTIDSIENFE